MKKTSRLGRLFSLFTKVPRELFVGPDRAVRTSLLGWRLGWESSPPSRIMRDSANCRDYLWKIRPDNFLQVVRLFFMGFFGAVRQPEGIENFPETVRGHIGGVVFRSVVRVRQGR
jgi:hypothetical protein